MQAGTIDEEASFERTPRGLEQVPQRSGHNVKDLGADLELSALLLYFVDQRMTHLAIIHDAGGGNANRRDAGNMRLHFSYFFRAQAHRRYAVL